MLQVFSNYFSFDVQISKSCFSNFCFCIRYRYNMLILLFRNVFIKLFYYMPKIFIIYLLGFFFSVCLLFAAHFFYYCCGSFLLMFFFYFRVFLFLFFYFILFCLNKITKNNVPFCWRKAFYFSQPCNLKSKERREMLFNVF